MRILGIETSCDDTSLAIVENGRKVLAHVTASQVKIHNITGGIVPEIAAREHVTHILPVFERLFQEANLSIYDIDAIAVTKGPGLVSSLLVGTLFASTLGMLYKKPLIPVHHIEGHIYGNWLERDPRTFHFPIMILTASGGHNDLIFMKDHGRYNYIGHTKDDAAGEAFDKVARILGLGYPGGPVIAEKALHGDPRAIPLPRAWLPGTFDFSFSGLKSEVLRIVEKELTTHNKLTPGFIADLSASFQESIIDVLSTKLIRAALSYNVQEVHLAGGVSANQSLRQRMEEKAGQHGLTLKYPVRIVYSTDNGAMIAAAGYFLYKKHWEKYKKWSNILPDPNLNLI
jgi:N6-L-threonylcarbamoyladenine synthase